MINTLIGISFTLVGDGAASSVDIDLGTQIVSTQLPAGQPVGVEFLTVSATGTQPAVTITSSSVKKNILTINFSAPLGAGSALGAYNIGGGLLY